MPSLRHLSVQFSGIGHAHTVVKVVISRALQGLRQKLQCSTATPLPSPGPWWPGFHFVSKNLAKDRFQVPSITSAFFETAYLISIMSSGFIHCGIFSFPSSSGLGNILPYVYIKLFIYSSVDGREGCNTF